MKCPHCTVDFHDAEERRYIEKDPDGVWGYGVCRCSACRRIIVRLFAANQYLPNLNQWGNELASMLVRPKVAGRSPVPPQVPEKYAGDYREACLVLGDSAKSSAALSRRCLQHLLREEAKTKKKDLAEQIQEVLDSGKLPSHIADSLDSMRNTGNFAAHPIKSQSSGEIVEVEPGEAEWNLDTLEELFDFFFVSPAKTKERRDALNKKLADAGKPPLK